MVKGETKSGFKYEFDEQRANDMRYLSVINKLNDDISYLPTAVEMLLGEELAYKLYDHVALDDGRVPVDTVEAELKEIMTASDDIKNS